MILNPQDVRPPLLGPVNPSHDLTQGLRVLITFDEGAGFPLHHTVPQIVDVTNSDPSYIFTQKGGTDIPLWTVGPYGVAGLCTTTDMSWQIGNQINWMPLGQATVAVIRRKTDTTLRASTMFGTNDSGSERLGAHCPYSDGIVYWDFGGSGGGANRLTATGLTFTTNIEYWIFMGGPSGSSIYRNGIRVASQTTALTRGNIIAPYWINRGNGITTGDLQEFYFFGVWGREWSPGEIADWFADPYGLLRWNTHANRSLFSPSAPPGSLFRRTLSPFGARVGSRQNIR